MNLNDIHLQVFSPPLCRICLQSNCPLRPINSTKAAEMLTDCNFCDLSETDEFPKDICLNCLQILEQCFEFKQLCKKSETTLKNLIKERDKINKELEGMKLYVPKFQGPDETEEYSTDCLEYRNEESQDDLIGFLEKPLPPPLEHSCETCNQSFSEKDDLRIHQAVHSSDLICVECSKQFKTRQHLKRHVKIHLIKKPHICKICCKGFSESYSLVKHLKYKHAGVPKEKRYFCTECGQGFLEPYYLKVHQRKHTGERPLVCSQCDKRFADPRSFRTHIKTHCERPRPYKCHLCLRSFLQNSTLTRHLRVHSGEKPFVCNVCDKRFSQSSSLAKHCEKHK